MCPGLTALVLFAATPANAQSGGWQVDLSPLYLFAATTSGNLAVNGVRNVPVYLDFADAIDKLAGAFTVHVEARRGQWGVLGDVNYLRLSTDVSYTTPTLSVPITGTLKLDQTIVNAKVAYEVKPGTSFHVVGGIRTMTVSPSAHFTGPAGAELADVNPSVTKAAAVGGFIYRPKLANKVTLLTQADVGGGSVFTWSALGGVELLIKPWAGLAVGYGALGADTGSVPKSGNASINELEFAVTQYGPVFSLTFHFAQK